MANLFRKIFLNPRKRMILDFIDEHHDAVHYFVVKETGHFVTHTVSIERDHMVLSASLRKDVYICPKNPIKPCIVLPTFVSYALSCNKQCADSECLLNERPFIQERDLRDKRGSKFPLRVYNTMLDYYILHHGLPHNVK